MNTQKTPWEMVFGRKREDVDRVTAIGPHKFARSPSDAVQLLTDLVTSADRLHRALALAPRELREHPTVSLFGKDAEYFDFKNLLNGVPVFWWTKETAELVFAASQSYPLEAEEAVAVNLLNKPPAYFPRVPRGLAVFEKPPLYIDLEGQQVPLSAVMWGVGIGIRDRKAVLRMYGMSWHASMASVIFESVGGTSGEDSSSPEEDPNGTFPAERLMLARWVCSAAMFIEQELVRSEPVNIERHVAKRIKGVLLEVPTCHVVTLRRESTESIGGTDSGIDVEWSHRWLVRGHWRNQFFPSRGANAPVWIHPHVKGPADKPFREPKETVFRVAR